MEELQYKNESGSLQISHRKARSHHMAISHFHDNYEIYYLMSGQRAFFIKDRTIVVGAGDVVIVSPNVLHRTTNAAMPEHERLVLNMHESCMAAENAEVPDVLMPLREKDYVVVRLSLHDRLAVDELARALQRELRERMPGYELYARTLSQQLLLLCVRQLGPGSQEPKLDAPSPMHERVSEIVRYINGHYMQELSLQLVADRFYVSSYYLSRSFKEATGFTFVEYLSSVRVKEAKKLLEETTLKVAQIAKRVGFGSVTHFGRVFKTVTGHAPLYYRKGGQ